MAQRYFNLVLDPKSAKGQAELARGLISTLDLYECFHIIRRQSTWAEETPRVALSSSSDSKAEVRDEKQADLYGPAVEPPPSGAGTDGAGSVAVSCTSSRSSRNAVGQRGTRCSPFAMAAAD